MIAEENKRQRPQGASETGDLTSTEGLLERILDRYVRATFAITTDCKLLYQNAAARALTARKDWVKLRVGRLQFTDRTLLKQITDHLSGAPTSRQTAMLRSPAGENGEASRVTYRVLVTPLYAEQHPRDRQIWLLFVSEFNLERKIEGQVLRQLYNLTHTEALLVACLFAGNSLADAAKVLDISINTAKTLLRRAFLKCGVQSQSELLQLVALGPRTL